MYAILKYCGQEQRCVKFINLKKIRYLMKKLKCQCGAIEAEINIPNNFEKILRCNCSLCKRKGAVMSMVKMKILKLQRQR